MKSTDIMLDLTSEKFTNFYNEKILPNVLPIEQERKKYTTLRIVAIALIIIISIIIAAISYSTNPQGKIHISTEAIYAVGFLCVAVWIFVTKYLKSLISGKIKPFLFSYLEGFKFIDNTIEISRILPSIVAELKLFNHFEGIDVDDYIKGKYNDLEVEITETDIYYWVRTNKGGRKKRSIFKGLIFEVEMNKKTDAHTIIKTDKGKFQPNKIDNLQNVKLEDIEFEKEFEVYSDDQIQSRYILTPSFMSRLLKYKRAKKQKVEVAFYNDRAYFFLPFNKDKFEAPLNKPITDIAFYRNILFEFAQILSLADALKLEEKIGL